MNIIKIVGDTNIPLELTVFTLEGAGYTGLHPVLAIRRTVDSYYLDFDDNVFKSSGWTTRQVVMTEVDPVHSAGTYAYSWDSSLSVTTPGDYAIEYNVGVVNYTSDVDYVNFTLEDVALVRKFMYNRRYIDKTLAYPTEILYDDDGVTRIFAWQLTHSDTRDERTPVAVPPTTTTTAAPTTTTTLAPTTTTTAGP